MIHQRNRQAGGTLLGLIIGLIIGLAIAVGVAITLSVACAMTEVRAEDASPWQRDAHSALRLLAGSRSGAVLLGGVSIQLQPGWKTYWRTPGDSGVPPRFDFSKSDNVEAVTVLWPAPEGYRGDAHAAEVDPVLRAVTVDDVLTAARDQLSAGLSTGLRTGRGAGRPAPR